MTTPPKSNHCELLAKEAAGEAATACDDDVGQLQLRHLIGFNGQTVGGLIVHPLGQELVYTVGFNIIIEKLVGKGVGKQELLTGHTGTITAIALSNDGRFMASGQEIPQDCKAPVILWEWCTREKLMEWPLHRSRVSCLSFTCYTKHFVTLGGQDDGHLAVWSAALKKPLVYKVAQIVRAGYMYTIATSKVDDSLFATAGDSYGRIWSFNTVDSSLTHEELKFGTHSRSIICMEIADLDNSKLPMIFCGTTSGDVLIFHGRSGSLQIVVPAKKRFSLGVTVLTYVRMLNENTFCLLLGTGEGKVGCYSIQVNVIGTSKASGKMSLMEDKTLWSDPRNTTAVTSISKVGAGHQFYIGMRGCSFYRMSLDPWQAELVRTCTCNPVLALAFPRDTEQLMVTGEFGMVRVINLCLLLEVRRYCRVNRTCLALALNHDGTHIFTGWDNGETIVLGFEPKELTLREIYRIDTTQKQAVTALALTSKSEVLVSGGNDGQVRVWRLVDDIDVNGRRIRQGLLLHMMTDHTGPITMIQISDGDDTCASSSVDGTAVIYDLVKGKRQIMVKVDLGFNGVGLCSDGLHLITCGADGKLYYYEIMSGASLRILQGCKYGALTCLDLEKTQKKLLATCGDDKLVKLWRVEEGEVTHVGQGHSETILRVKFGPCGTVLVSSSKDGAICLWNLPHQS